MQRKLDVPRTAGIFGHAPALLLLTISVANLAGCAVIKGIFKAGVWAGVIGAAFVMLIIIGLTRAFGRH